MKNCDYRMWEEELTTKWAGRHLVFQPVLESTNVTAAALGNQGAVHGTLVTADQQTGGRGRRGRTWESPAGKNLYFSLLLRPSFEPEKAPMLTLVMAHSVAETLQAVREEVVPKDADTEKDDRGKIPGRCSMPGIKWPNDILINGKKVCGILTEMKVEKGRICHVVIGVGINVKEQIFEGELAEKASSLEQEWKVKLSREKLLARIMKAFEEDYELFEASGDLKPLQETYEKKLVNKGALVKVLDPQGAFEGNAEGITETGELIVRKNDGRVTNVYAGEVSVRGMQGYV